MQIFSPNIEYILDRQNNLRSKIILDTRDTCTANMWLRIYFQILISHNVRYTDDELKSIKHKKKWKISQAVWYNKTTDTLLIITPTSFEDWEGRCLSVDETVNRSHTIWQFSHLHQQS